ncbi:MAG: phosphopentomutase [Hespellia sp.]|nr:phosphopentomutase [Hespellia sp.]
MKKRVFLIVLDSAGVGEAPDADQFGDVGCDTFGTCVRSGKLHVPNMSRLGLYNIDGTSFRKEQEEVSGCYGKLQEQSAGKDTTVGHWEIAGMISRQAMPTYPNGFPKEVIEEFEAMTGRKALCNQVYSGTDVIRDYGKEQVETGGLIVYTSADSVFQIAAHEEVVPLEELYDICRKTRAMLQGEHGVGRVIARPFVGTYPDYIRTVNRHDFSLEPPKDTILDTLTAAGLDTIGVGKIYDIFAGKGVQETYANEGNKINMERTLSLLEKDFHGLCFVNLVDFDMLYGHRNDIPGYVNALNEVDVQLGQFMEKMAPEDLLIITADHGCDPGFKGTDHSREYIPVLCYGESLKKNVNLGVRSSYADIAQTVMEYLEVAYEGDGDSFLGEIEK